MEPSCRVNADANGVRRSVLSEAELHENPLVPNRKLRQLYVAMVEARVLDEHLAGRKDAKKRRRPQSTRGEEACRVSTAIDLQAGDLISDSLPGVMMDWVSGAKVGSLLRRTAGQVSGAQIAQVEGLRQLPWITDASERLRLAMGAALSLKIRKQTNLVVAYAQQGETGRREWRRILEIAFILELPIFFVVLPSHPGVRKSSARTKTIDRIKSHRVPEILVDANDAVALYRVAQETFGRIRGGGGPVLVQCVARLPERSRRTPAGDPLIQMADFLLERKVATEHWVNHAGDTMRRRIEAVKR